MIILVFNMQEDDNIDDTYAKCHVFLYICKRVRMRVEMEHLY